jgi:predicted nuclease of predicted toxin-antitoxin system
MRLLADENFPVPSIGHLRAAGHDVVAIKEESPSLADTAVLATAVRTGRTLLTFDRDFGDLIYRRGLAAPPAVLYFRFLPATPAEPAELFLHIVGRAEIGLEGMFTVVERDRVRQRPLP